MDKLFNLYNKRLSQQKSFDTMTNISDFRKNYKYGTMTADDKQKFIKITPDNKLIGFDQCIKSARTSGAICEPQGNTSFCPYMGYQPSASDADFGDCFVGGSENDSSNFSGTTGIDVYLTPATGTADLISQTKTSVSGLIQKMGNEKIKLDSQIKNANLYLEALRTGKSHNEIIRQSEETNLKQNQLASTNKILNETRQINSIVNDVSTKDNTLSSLLKEKEQRLNEKSKNIEKDSNKLGYLDKKILTLTQLISQNDTKYVINGHVVKLLYLVLFILVISAFVIFAFYSIKRGRATE